MSRCRPGSHVGPPFPLGCHLLLISLTSLPSLDHLTNQPEPRLLKNFISFLILEGELGKVAVVRSRKTKNGTKNGTVWCGDCGNMWGLGKHVWVLLLGNDKVSLMPLNSRPSKQSIKRQNIDSCGSRWEVNKYILMEMKLASKKAMTRAALKRIQS